MSTRQLRRLIERGEVRGVLRSVYVRAECPDSLDLRAAAAGLVLPEHVIVADQSAAWLHGVDCRDPWELHVVPPLDVVSVRGKEPTRRAGTLGGVRDLAPEDVMVLGGIRVTTPLRTAADLGCRWGRSSALAVLDAFAHAHGVTAADLARLAVRFRGRRGVTQLRALIPLIEPLTESPGESWSRLAIIDAGLPTPAAQVWVRIGDKRYRLDLAWPWFRIAVEYDGREFHDEEQRAADLVRRKALRDAGWIVIVVRAEDLRGPALDAWLGELRTALADRTPARGRRYARASRPGRGVPV